ncbi:fucolectin-like [Tachysurus vachellii]|uniref:fucolectin-like n=1 Tax=Tachysurus vachellii TaxID=175792 RepID=UPI00296AA218|nr:fucolectin-like [Tachysurus vachellii]
MTSISFQKMENSQRSMHLYLGICILSLQWILTYQQVNVALRGIATQSSLYTYYYASLAIDGNRNSVLSASSCSHTKADYGPWWRVDLLVLYDISNVIITNRGDSSPDRINGAEIHIGNSLINNGNNNPRCVVIPSMPAGTINYTCNMRGRYVNVIIPNIVQYLTLCEVEVNGVPVPVFKKAFLRINFKSIEDLSNPTMRDKILQKVKSANIQPAVFQVQWTKEPELEKRT